MLLTLWFMCYIKLIICVMLQPIIPLFTRNVRESFRAVGLFKRMWLRLYSWTRFPLVPIYGGFPVKLTTYIGTPIPYDSSLSPEDLAAKVWWKLTFWWLYYTFSSSILNLGYANLEIRYLWIIRYLCNF